MAPNESSNPGDVEHKKRLPDGTFIDAGRLTYSALDPVGRHRPAVTSDVVRPSRQAAEDSVPLTAIPIARMPVPPKPEPSPAHVHPHARNCRQTVEERSRRPRTRRRIQAWESIVRF